MVRSISISNSNNNNNNNNKNNNKGGKSMMKTQYKGVRMRSWGSWVSEIRAPNQKTRIWLGSYSTPVAAARAYDAALLCLKGPSASLNFPLSSDLDVPPNTQLSVKSIQRLAAAAAANASTTPLSTSPSPSPLPSPSSPVISSDTSCCTATLPEESVDSTWFDSADAFESPMCMELMLAHCAFFAPSPLPQEEEFDEVGDISLWNFY